MASNISVHIFSPSIHPFLRTCVGKQTDRQKDMHGDSNNSIPNVCREYNYPWLLARPDFPSVNLQPIHHCVVHVYLREYIRIAVIWHMATTS